VKPNRGDSLDEENTQTRVDIQELRVAAEGSNRQPKANAAAAKPNNRKIKSEEQKSKDSEKIKVHPSSKSRFSEVKKKWSRMTLLIITIRKFDMPPGEGTKERCDHLFELFQEDADG
jgi:hypothetical protein